MDSSAGSNPRRYSIHSDTIHEEEDVRSEATTVELPSLSDFLLTAADLLNDRVLPFHEEYDLPVLRIMTDRGTEYCGRVDKHDFQLFLAINDIDHTKTKVNHYRLMPVASRLECNSRY